MSRYFLFVIGLVVSCTTLELPQVCAGDINEAYLEAARRGNIAEIEQYISHGADVQALDAYGKNALFIAAESGHKEAVYALMLKGVRANKQDNFYSGSAMSRAAENGHGDVVAMLVVNNVRGADLALNIGARRGDLDVVEGALAKQPLSQETMTSALTTAAANGHKHIVAYLKGKGAVPLPKIVPVPLPVLKSYVGDYALKHFGIMHVRLVEGQLMSALGEGMAFPIFAESDVRFFYKQGPAKHTFVKNEKGEVTGLVFSMGKSKIEGTRIGGGSVRIGIEIFERYVGKYQNEQGDKRQVVLVGTALKMLYGDRDQGKPISGVSNIYDLVTKSATEFSIRQVEGMSVEFRSKNGLVVGLEIRQGDDVSTWRRVDVNPGGEQRVEVKVPLPGWKPILSAHWPQFRGVGANGIGDGHKPPVTWDVSKAEHLLWKTPIPGLGHSSPVVWGDRVFVTTATGEKEPRTRVEPHNALDPVDEPWKHSWRVYCLDRKTGKVLWERTAHEGVPRVKRHPKGSHANSTPAVDAKHVVVNFGSEGVYCYNHAGTLKWSRNLGLLDSGWFYDRTYQWGYASSPILHEDRAIIQVDRQRDSFIVALSLIDGKEVWRTKRDEIPSWGTPTLVTAGKSTEIVTNGSRAIRGYDAETGRELWSLSGNSEITVATPVSAYGLVYVTGGYPKIQPIYAIKPGARGDISLKDNRSSNEHVLWSYANHGTLVPTPIVYGEHLYTCTGEGVLTCYDARTGAQVYREQLGGGKGGAFSASPVAADGRLYITSEDGHVYVVGAGDTFTLLSVNPMGEACMATPAIVDRMMIFHTRHHVVAIAQ